MMVKKYRGGRQEGVFLKKGFTLFWIYYSTFAFLLRTRFFVVVCTFKGGVNCVFNNLDFKCF